MTSTPNLVLSHTSISYEKAASLLKRQIEINYQKKDGLGSLVSTVEEIYQNCQRRLEEYLNCRFVIKGSAVASLFSDEPYNDIDIHTAVDLTIYPHHERVSKGYRIKWALIHGIVDSILKSSQKAAGDSCNISADNLLFEEENIIFSTKSSRPFNVHTLRIGKPMLEFTCVAFVREQEMQLRSFDFNSGALEMHVDCNSNITIFSHLPDIERTLGQITSRTLDTIEPEKIEKKAVERYLAKILLSGYSDPSQTLYPSLFHHPQYEKNSNAKESVEKIANHMKMRGLSNLATITALWLMKADTADLKALSKYCRDLSLSREQSTHTPQGTYIINLIEKRRKPELCWFLLLSAENIRIVSHRGERSIQLQLSTYPLFEQFNKQKTMFVIFPLIYLTQIKDYLDAAPFFVMSSYLNPLSHDAIAPAFRDELKTIFAKHLAKKEMFPILAAVFDRFELKTTKAFTRLYMHWSESCTETEMKQMPSHLIHRILETIEESDVNSKKRAQQILGLIFTAISEKDIYNYDKARNNQFISKILYKELKNYDLKEDMVLLLKYAKQLSHDFISDMQGRGEGLTDRDKTIMQMVYALYQRSVLTVKDITDTIHICLQKGRGDTGLKFFEEILTKEQTLDIESLYDVILSFARQSPEELIRLLRGKDLLFLSKRKGEIECFSQMLIQLLYEEKSISSTTFSDLVILCFSKGERNYICKEILCRQDVNSLHSTLPFLLSEWNISLSEVMPIHDMQLHQLRISWNHLKCSGIKEENIHDVEKILFAIMDSQEEDVSLEIAMELSKQHHKSFFQQTLRSACFSFFTLSNTVSLIENIIGSLDKEIDHDESKTFCIHALDVISSHLSLLDFFDDPVLSKFQSLHRSLFIQHIDHPIWNKFWNSSKLQNIDRNIDIWIDGKFLNRAFLNPHILNKIKPFIKCLDIHPTLVFDILSVLKKEPIEECQVDFLFDILSSLDEQIWKSTRPNEKVPPELSTFLMQIIFPYIQRPVQTQEEIERLNIIFNAMGLCSWFADSKCRDLIMKRLLNLLVLSKQSALFFAMSGKPDLIFMHCLEGALEERKWEEISTLKEVYAEFFSTEGRRTSLNRKQICLITENKDRFIKRCKLWQTILSKQERNVGADKAAIELFVVYLNDMINSISDEISLDTSVDSKEKLQSFSQEKSILLNELKSECIVQYFDLFDTLIKKKKVDCTNILPMTVNLHSVLNEKQRAEFTEKFLSLACEILKSIGKQSGIARPWTDLSTLLNYCIIHISIANADKIKKQEEISICHLLDNAIPVITKLFPLLSLDHTFVHLISFLEGTLSKDMANEHIFSWGESIIARRDSVCFEELSLFGIYIFRLDKNISDSVSLGINKDMFLDKLFIDESSFQNTKILDLFVELFDIGFSRFHQNIGKIWTKETYSRVDIFALFNVYCLAIQNGIISKKHKPEFNRLQLAMINMLEPAVFSPKNRLSILLVRTMLNFILISDQHGQITLRSSSKDQLKRFVKIYARCIDLIATDHAEFSEYNFNLFVLKGVFDFHRDVIRRTLDKEEFQRLIYNLEVIASPEERYFTPIQSDSSDEISSTEELKQADQRGAEVETSSVDPETDSLISQFLLGEAAIAAEKVCLYDFYLQRFINETDEEDLVSPFLNALSNDSI